jgi:hypothetical protein
VALPDGTDAVGVAVVLPRRPNDLGEWIADGTAFEAAGADALRIDPVPEPWLDPLVLTAALAAVTARALLITTLPTAGPATPALGRMLATITQVSRGRLAVVAEADPAGTGGKLPRFRPAPDDPDTLEDLRAPEPVRRWVRVPAPDSRATWREILADTARRGYHGLLVPADPRLLDILRNPEDPGMRGDLQLAQG